MMKDPVRGVCLLQRQPCLPALTFVAGDATAWVSDHVEGATSETAAVDLLQVSHCVLRYLGKKGYCYRR